VITYHDLDGIFGVKREVNLEFVSPHFFQHNSYVTVTYTVPPVKTTWMSIWVEYLNQVASLEHQQGLQALHQPPQHLGTGQ
jgi:hypothetical protein